MFRSLITECRSVLVEDGEEESADKPQTVNTAEVAPKAKRRNKHDRAAHKVGDLLGTPPQNLSRKKMLKMIPHMMHHFEKGHGAGEGDYRTVDADDLATLGRHASNISAHANAMLRMPGPAHHMASHLCNHVANAHDRMSKYFKMNADDESAELHSNECEKHRSLAADHRKKARRHGHYDGQY
jgi:hypothetical protein